MPKQRTQRHYLRNGRYWADFRDLGGGRERLVAEGEKMATKDLDTALRLITERVEELKDQKGRRSRGEKEEARTTLAEAITFHLDDMAENSDVTDGWIGESEHMLKRAIAYFGEDMELASIGTMEVKNWIKRLKKTDNGRGGKLSNGTIRHHLFTLSKLYWTAVEEGWVEKSENPVDNLKSDSMPKVKAEEAKWFESPEASLILAAAMRYQSKKPRASIPFPGALVATFLLTGGRKAEVLGLEAEDVIFDREIIHFRENSHRRLKTSTSTRTVPIWPQLRPILQRHIFKDGHLSGLLFPSWSTGRMIHDLEKMFDGLARYIGWENGSIRSKMFRHTYCSQRLQTFEWVKTGEDEDGKPILSAIPTDDKTVAVEMGHGGTSLVKRVYGHLGKIKHRSEHVEYRVENHKEVLRDKLTALGIGV